MKKTLSANIVFVVLFSLGLTANINAMELIPITYFDSTWVIETLGTATATVTTDGAKVNLSAHGSATDRIDKDFIKKGTSGIVGMAATLRVDQATSDSTGTCAIGIEQSIGKINNSRIKLRIVLFQENNKKSIKFYLHAYDLTTEVLTVLAKGYFGDTDGGWSNGDSKTVAFARVGSEFWFYVAGETGLIKIQALDLVTSYNGSPKITIWADQGAGNSISGSVSDIYLIYQ